MSTEGVLEKRFLMFRLNISGVFVSRFLSHNRKTKTVSLSYIFNKKLMHRN